MHNSSAQTANDSSIETDIFEQPIDVDPDSGLFGVLTRPQRNLKETGFIFINSGLLHRVGPFRLYVDLAREIARAGYASIRLDQSGKGDSDAIPGVSVADATIANVTAAARLLKEKTGANKYVIGGLCSGADDALQAGLEMDNLIGLFMFDGYAPRTARFYVHRYGPKLFSVRSWRNRPQRTSNGQQQPGDDIGNLRNWGTSAEMMQRYRSLLDRGIHINAIFSGWAGNCYEYSSQLTATIGHSQAVSLVSEQHYADATHLFPVSAHRQQAVKDFCAWAERCFPNGASS